MGHLHRPNISELDVMSDLSFDEEQDKQASNTKKAANWFLRSGIFMLSGIVVVAGLTIVTISYLENTTNSSSIASEPVPMEQVVDESQNSEPMKLESGQQELAASTSAQTASITWEPFTSSTGFSFDYPANWTQVVDTIQLNSLSQTQVEQLNQKMTANCSNCPDTLEQLGKLEVVSTIGNCQMSDAQLDVIAEKYYLLTNPTLKRSDYSLVTNKNGDCGIAYVTSSAVDNSPENFYFRAHWLQDGKLFTVEIPLAASGELEVFDESTEPDFTQEPLSSIILTYQQLVNTLQFP